MVSYLCVSVSVQYVLSDISVTSLQLCILTYRWEKLLSTRPKLKKKKKKKNSTSEWGQALAVSSSHVKIYSYQTANESGKAHCISQPIPWSWSLKTIMYCKTNTSINLSALSQPLYPFDHMYHCHVTGVLKSPRSTDNNNRGSASSLLDSQWTVMFFGRYIISVYRSCSVPLVFFGGEQSHSGHGDRLRWQATVSELTCFLWLCLSEQCLPKKRRCIMGPTLWYVPLWSLS